MSKHDDLLTVFVQIWQDNEMMWWYKVKNEDDITIDHGDTLTRRGAKRKAKRAAKRYKEKSRTVQGESFSYTLEV